VNPKELRALETTLKKIGKHAERLESGINPKHSKPAMTGGFPNRLSCELHPAVL
jgi:hypothetical protein